MRTLIAIALATALTATTPAYADHGVVTATHAGVYCFAVQFDKNQQWFGIGLTEENRHPPSLVGKQGQITSLLLSKSTGSEVGYDVAGTYPCRASLGENILGIENINNPPLPNQ
jgi:hypothetical protein